MSTSVLPGRLGTVSMDGELPSRESLATVFDERDDRSQIPFPGGLLPE
jgi:hypothetical protein